MARPRKAIEQRRHRGTKDIGVVSARKGRIPQAHQDWADSVKKAWREFWQSAPASVVDEKADMPGITRLFGLYNERENLTPLILSSPLIKGSVGQLRVNPLTARLDEVDKQITALEDRFGMSPKARLNIGMRLELQEMRRSIPPMASVHRLRAVDPADAGEE